MHSAKRKIKIDRFDPVSHPHLPWVRFQLIYSLGLNWTLTDSPITGTAEVAYWGYVQGILRL